MSATPEQQAADPTTPPQALADLAATYPQLQPVIALNPATYEGLLDWLRQYGGADVQAALAARAAGATPPPPFATTAPPPPPAAASAPPQLSVPPVVSAPGGRFVEPSRSIPITYLNHDLRYVLALLGVGLAVLFHVVIVPVILNLVTSAIYRNGYGEAQAIQSTIVSFIVDLLPWLLLGAAVFVLPARLKNKKLALALVAGPIALSFVLMLANIVRIMNGFGVFHPATVLSFATLLFPAAAVAAWLAARMRPGAAFALLPLTILPLLLRFFTGRGLWGEYQYYGSGNDGFGTFLSLLGIGILVGIAWLGRLIAARQATAPTPEERGAALEAHQHAARVAHVQQWEAAYAAAHGGMAPPPGSVVPPMTTYAAPGADSGRTNMMAILALVFGVGGGLLGIVFGHIALAQIRRTGEQGRGLALAGLICGYIGAVILLGVIIFYIGIFATLGRYY